MTKQREFEQPPEGHVGLLVYDSDTNKWYAVLGDDAGHIQLDVASVALPTGAAIAAKQLANDHDVNVSNMISGFATSAKQLRDGHNVTVDNASIPVTQTTPANLTPGIMGWNGSAWHKQPMILGYSEPWAEKLTATAAGAENLENDTDTIDAGYVYVAQIISGYHDAGIARWVQFGVEDSPVTPLLLEKTDLDSGVNLYWNGEIILWPGSTVHGWCEAPGAGKHFYMHIWGYKIKLAE